jgi:hypothetical protein
VLISLAQFAAVLKLLLLTLIVRGRLRIDGDCQTPVLLHGISEGPEFLKSTFYFLGVWILDEVMKGSISFCSAVAAFVT